MLWPMAKAVWFPDPRVGRLARKDQAWSVSDNRGGEQPGHPWFADHYIGLAGDWLSGGRVEGAFDSACGLVVEMNAVPTTQ